MVPAQHSAHDTKAVFNSKEEDLFYLFKNPSTAEDHRKRVKIKSLDELIRGFLRDERGIFEKYRPCELDCQNGEGEANEANPAGEANVANPADQPNEANPADKLSENRGAPNPKNLPPIRINNQYNDLLLLSRKDMDSERFHLKKIQKACTKVCNSLKFYKAENHDKHKFRPTNINTDVIKIKHDLEVLQYSNHAVCPGNDAEKTALRMVQEKCKKIVQGLNFNCDSVDVAEVIDLLNVITTPDFDERLDKSKYLKLFLNKYHYVYPYEDIGGLRKIRKYIRTKHLTRGDFYIDHSDISKFYLKTNLEKIIKNEQFINNMLNLHIDNGKFWVQLVHNIWIPLAMEIFNTTRNSFYSYLMNYDNDASVLDQYVYSRANGKFYKFSHYIFTGALFSGVPSIYRLLMRLHAYKYSEVRINMTLQKNSRNIYNDVVISSLNYHIDVIRNLFPFFKEYKHVDMEKIVESFFDSAFFNLIMNSLRKKNIEKVTVSQKYLTFVNSFFLMITEFLYGVSNKNCLEKINENQIKLLDILNEIFYDDMNILIGRDVLLFVADLLCLYKLRSIYIKKKYCEHILHMTKIIKKMYYHKSSLTNESTWKQVYVIAVKIHHFVSCACSERCKLTHLISSHHNVCVYFKTVPSFLKFSNLVDDPAFDKMKYLNIFQHIDTFDRGNDTYQVIY